VHVAGVDRLGPPLDVGSDLLFVVGHHQLRLERAAILIARSSGTG
jgi:hypothetical protein